MAKIGDKGYPTLEAAFADAQNGETVVLVDDLTLDAALTIAEANAIFDLNGKTINYGANAITFNNDTIVLTNGTFTGAQDSSCGVVTLNGNSTVTIASNATFNTWGTYKFEVDDANLELYGSIICGGNSKEDEAGQAAIHANVAGAVINVYDGAFVKCAIADAFRLNYEPPAGTTGGMTLNVYGGTFESHSYPCLYAYKKGNISQVNIYGGTWNAIAGDAGQGIFQIKDDALEFRLLDDKCKAKFNYSGKSSWVGSKTLAELCAPGYGPVLGNDGYYTIQAVYDITIAPTANGTVETSVTNGIAAGTEVTITATPATDYAVDTIAVTNGDAEVAVDGGKFVMPAGDVTVYVTFKSTAPDFPVDPDVPVTEKGEENIATAKEVFGDGLADYITAVYGEGGTIPASKLNATTPDLIKIAQAYELPIMTEPKVEITKAAEGTAFEFQILDDNVPVAIQANKVRSMVEFTSDLGTAFGAALEKDVTVAIKADTENKTATADFTKATAAGFMRVKLAVPAK